MAKYNPGPKVPVQMDARRGPKGARRTVKVTAYIPEKTAATLKLTVAKTSALSTKDAIGKNKKGHKILKVKRPDKNVGKVIDINFGATVQGRKLAEAQVTVPNGVSLATFAELVAASPAIAVRWEGNRNWYELPGS